MLMIMGDYSDNADAESENDDVWFLLMWTMCVDDGDRNVDDDVWWCWWMMMVVYDG